ncbi:FAS1-like dehydratase domain-containing protein [Roseomonas marmotae]|uniref:MaoC family dehydratase N-terminal domain-containing protein n=1 Tax=Roseomonas marmotae TaxID=2768161 RepID=A0ABS3KBZ1_9PROT|nr:MaoC family dehydratase N-terminal domain-containing protein [Roseomonas marmotae]MBO1074998.1 MaoC family dehydratase N-terminal domain-containing protein [Roseomonas marmotae]QTI79966.1 MaoC family dehydratase N-terminal domain-containing protein [Roseomonas marmotae]
MSQQTEGDYAAWIGRREQQRDIVAAGPLDRLAATLDREDPPATAGDAAPPLSHWIMFLPDARQSSLGLDGHPARGGFLPPVHHLPRRMWAGGRLSFHAPLRVGMAVTRSSTIADVSRRAGASGELVFVTVRHEIREDGQDAVLLAEEHDIVYRSGEAAAVKAAPEAPPPGAWQRSLVPDAVMLFRYSALTFNGHRIHYDRDYVTREEGYPGLIVHGPLVATLLLDLLRRRMPEAGVSHFSFRALSPLFDGAPVTLHGTPPDAEGRIMLWATNPAGGLAMRAEARIG